MIDLLESVAAHVAQLAVPADVNGTALLLAIADNETSGGTRAAASKHENAYCYSGPYFNKQLAELSREWGCAAHSSWGPWQIMYITAVEAGYSGDPVALRSADASLPFVIETLNRRVFKRLFFVTLSDIFDAWNSGTARDHIIPSEYIARGI